jgi:hypothetical protein
VDIGRHELHFHGQLLGGAVGSLFKERGQQDPARRGRTTTALAESVEHFFDLFGVDAVAINTGCRTVRW